MVGDGLRRLRARPVGAAAAVLDALPEEARREAVEVEGLGTERVEAFGSPWSSARRIMPCTVAKACSGKSREAKHRSAQARALGPILRARPVEQDVAVVGFADVAAPPSGGRACARAQGGVLVAPVLAGMHGDALAALFEEHFHHALAYARRDNAAADM